MQRIVALWNSNWLGKVIIGGVGLLLVCCVIGVFARGRAASPTAQATTAPAVAQAPAPTEPPEATRAPRPSAAPKPTETLVPTFTPAPSITPNPNIKHAGVAPLNKDDCPPDYLIKGNKNSGLYHTPGDRGYEQTDPERCFATIADAEAAGFKASK